MKSQFSRWLPALLMMLVIFWFSAQPGAKIPIFDWMDLIIKKSGHIIGYGLLTLSYLWGFDFKKEKYWIAWLLAILYASTDEFHQSFVQGRHATLWDVVIFDNLGSLIALWLVNYYQKRLRDIGPAVEERSR